MLGARHRVALLVEVFEGDVDRGLVPAQHVLGVQRVLSCGGEATTPAARPAAGARGPRTRPIQAPSSASISIAVRPTGTLPRAQQDGGGVDVRRSSPWRPAAPTAHPARPRWWPAAACTGGGQHHHPARRPAGCPTPAPTWHRRRRPHPGRPQPRQHSVGGSAARVSSSSASPASTQFRALRPSAPARPAIPWTSTCCEDRRAALRSAWRPRCLPLDVGIPSSKRSSPADASTRVLGPQAGVLGSPAHPTRATSEATYPASSSYEVDG